MDQIAIDGRKPRRSLRRGEEGFTLVEMLVVITIIGMIMALVGPRVLTYLTKSKVKAPGFKFKASPARLIFFIWMPAAFLRAQKVLRPWCGRRREWPRGTDLICGAATCRMILGAPPIFTACPASTAPTI